MKAELLGFFGDDLMITNAARVSMGKWKDRFDESDAKLIHYLAEQGHWTPFSHPQVQLRITAPIFVARQWFRSTVGVARNEQSMRYVDEPLGFYSPDEWRSRPDGSIKQGSGEPLPQPEQGEAKWVSNLAINFARRSYEDLLAMGTAPEQARMVLPQSMETQWIETGSLAYYARIVKQRLDGHAQAEIQDLALQVLQIIQPLFPVSWAALMESGR